MVKHGQIFSADTQAVFYNWKQKPIQRMLDFDYLCGALSSCASIKAVNAVISFRLPLRSTRYLCQFATVSANACSHSSKPQSQTNREEAQSELRFLEEHGVIVTQVVVHLQ